MLGSRKQIIRRVENSLKKRYMKLLLLPAINNARSRTYQRELFSKRLKIMRGVAKSVNKRDIEKSTLQKTLRVVADSSNKGYAESLKIRINRKL